MDYDPTHPFLQRNDEAFKKFFNVESEFMAAQGYSHNAEKAITRSIVVTLIEMLSKGSDYDAFVPYLAMNYLDRMLSRKSHLPALERNPCKNTKLFAICCFTLASKTRNGDFSVPNFLFKPSIIVASAVLSASFEAFPAQILQHAEAFLRCQYIDKDALLLCMEAMEIEVQQDLEGLKEVVKLDEAKKIEEEEASKIREAKRMEEIKELWEQGKKFAEDMKIVEAKKKEETKKKEEAKKEKKEEDKNMGKKVEKMEEAKKSEEETSVGGTKMEEAKKSEEAVKKSDEARKIEEAIVGGIKFEEGQKMEEAQKNEEVKDIKDKGKKVLRGIKIEEGKKTEEMKKVEEAKDFKNKGKGKVDEGPDSEELELRKSRKAAKWHRKRSKGRSKVPGLHTIEEWQRLQVEDDKSSEEEEFVMNFELKWPVAELEGDMNFPESIPLPIPIPIPEGSRDRRGRWAITRQPTSATAVAARQAMAATTTAPQPKCCRSFCHGQRPPAPSAIHATVVDIFFTSHHSVHVATMGLSANIFPSSQIEYLRELSSVGQIYDESAASN
ncbi:vicilin-like seed storage protein At2g18540 [Camellia sinensis]|uniref:vicilin-like seed storage protein At2g18540 n=1 Tax=Camellia sinensis TaxID=4442 RepID=UPI001036B1D0|nr:vicilin-like seed storage protein At2g18540 [Camellia sinensis]